MKTLISFKKQKDVISVILENEKNYEVGVVLKNNDEFVSIKKYSKKEYSNDYKHFAAILGKFEPYTEILKVPIKVKDLKYSTLSSIKS